MEKTATELLGVEKFYDSSRIIGDCKTVIPALYKKAGLTEDEEFTSIENFIQKAHRLLEEAEEHYYDASEYDCQVALEKAMIVIGCARVFNNHFGL